MRRGTSGINALIAVDKPVGMTSHDVVSRVRRAVGERRVGHAGTLDPAASGVLVVGIGQGTRLMGLLTAERKGYVGLVALGSETDTDDAEGTVTREAPAPVWVTDAGRAGEAVAALVGDAMQVPPAYSAISVGGVRSYARARAGEKFELPARPVTIHDARLLAVQEVGGRPAWLCSFDVSKGCYIRSIARDLGRAVGSAAHLEALRRTSSGLVSVSDCVSLGGLEELGPRVVERALDPVRALGLAVRPLSEGEAADVACGRRVPVGPLASTLAEGQAACLVRDGRLLGIWRRQGEQLACSTNFPGGVTGVRS
ncbi:tRNA pseudouridine(55) synthase TruB [Olsenella uli]|uniref:tRNA pseudouridine(55) synthase TruB n=1 Tax=Olsenella uli TaxID=133926 RepID=UPI0012ABCF07|nr:tRNA pseudouridine(55) synthase TruB [Olsenella uli]